MKALIFLCMLSCPVVAQVPATQDTIVIPGGTLAGPDVVRIPGDRRILQ